MPDTGIGGMQGAVFNTILEVRVIDLVDHCGQGLFHQIAWQNRPIQIITLGVPGYLGIWEYLLDIPGTPSPDQQFSRATILAYDGQVAVVRHYPHLISPISVNTEMSVFLWRGDYRQSAHRPTLREPHIPQELQNQNPKRRSEKVFTTICRWGCITSITT